MTTAKGSMTAKRFRLFAKQAKPMVPRYPKTALHFQLMAISLPTREASRTKNVHSSHVHSSWKLLQYTYPIFFFLRAVETCISAKLDSLESVIHFGVHGVLIVGVLGRRFETFPINVFPTIALPVLWSLECIYLYFMQSCPFTGSPDHHF